MSIGHLKINLNFWTIFIKPDHCAWLGAVLSRAGAPPPPSRGSWQFKSLSSRAKAKTFRRPRKQRACDLTTFFGFNKFSTRIRQDIFWRKSGVRICQILHCAALTRIFNFLDFHFLVLQKKRLAAQSAFFQQIERPIKALHCWSLLLCSCFLVILYSLEWAGLAHAQSLENLLKALQFLPRLPDCNCCCVEN